MQEQASSRIMSRTIRPLCPRHSHEMNYDEKGIHWKEGMAGQLETLCSYHCTFLGCMVRYTPAEGYFTVIDTPDVPHFVEEPGINIHQCPRHGTWLYRSKEDNSEHGVTWRCAIEDCDYFKKESAALQAAG